MFTIIQKNINAIKLNDNINYKFEIKGNQLLLDNYLLTDVKNKFRDQEVNIYLYLPEGQLLKPDASVEDYDESDNDFFNLHFSSDDYIYKVGSSKIKCLNCPISENGFDDVEMNQETNANDTINEVSVKINGKEILNGKKTKGKLTTDKNGVIIKIN